MNTRDLELLSAYLDGQLDPNESARLETRIAADPELESALTDLRAARKILRQLPQRKAPRNFTLTRKMVGLNPPLPRSYAFFKFSTALATILLMLTFAVNLVTPRLAYVGPIMGWGRGGGYGGMGGGGIGGGPVAPQAAAPAPEEPSAAAEAPAPNSAASESSAMDAQPLPTMTPEMILPAPTAGAMAKVAPTEIPAQPSPPAVKSAAPISIQWQAFLAVIGLIGAAVMFSLRRAAKQKWQ